MPVGDFSGPLLFGYCLDIFLYGILTVQTYLYYLAFPQDKRTTKAIVYFVYIIGTLQTAFALHDFYSLFCTLRGNSFLEPPAQSTIYGFGFMWFTIPVGGALAATAVQLFYAHRIYVISKAKKITAIVFVLAFLQLSASIVTAAFLFRPGLTTGISAGGGISLFVGGVIGATCDLLIAIYMSHYLSRQMKGASKTTQVLVTKATRLLLETGILTAGMAMAYAVLSFSVPRSRLTWFMIPGLSLGKLYANSMLVLLNNRFTILGGRNTQHPDFDIPSYRHSVLAEVNAGPVVSHGIAFAHTRRVEATLSGGEVHTIELNPGQGRVSQESKEGSNKKAEVV